MKVCNLTVSMGRVGSGLTFLLRGWSGLVGSGWVS